MHAQNCQRSHTQEPRTGAHKRKMRLNRKSQLTILMVCATIVAATSFAPHNLSHASVLTSYNFSSSSTPPTIVGWGGVRLDESQPNSANPASQVFAGESASSMELQVQRLVARGFNGIRVSFQSACSSPQEMGSYDPIWLTRAITVAKHYNFWIIVDYHGYYDLETSTGVTCWLNYWDPIVQQFMGTYNQIIWEPINEPWMTSNIDVTSLSDAYQQWINQARSFGDTNWIVVQNLCSSICGFPNIADGYPTVNDTQGRIFISLHSYMAYKYYNSNWNNATADSLAQQFYNAVVSGSQRTGWPILNSEGGPDPQGLSCSGGVSLPSTLCAPDQVQVGSAGYGIATFHFIQALTSLYDSNTPQRINWLWWPMGSWTDTPLAEPTYGALSSDGWGSLLQYKPVSTQVGQTNPIIAVPGSQVASAYHLLTFQVSATGASASQNLILSASGLPTNSTFPQATGTIVSATFSWTPTHSQVGTYTVSFTATSTTDSSIYTTQTVTIQVQDAVSIIIANPPIVAVPSDQIVLAYSTLAFRVIAAGSTTNQIVVLSALSLPTNATFSLVTGNNVGTFSWTPTESQVGTYTIDFVATDAGNSSLYTTATVGIQVQSLASGRIHVPPIMVVPGARTITVGSTITFRVSATDANVPTETLTLSVSGQPTGSTFDASTGTFSWTPERGEEGTYIINFKAADNALPQMSDTKTVTVQVLAQTGGSCNSCGPLSFIVSILSAETLTWLVAGITAGFTISLLVIRSRALKHRETGRGNA